MPSSTYRLQLHAGFTLDQAVEQIDYLARLGISHIYASPYLQAVPGSMHGYDVMDPTQVNVELGGEEAHQRFTAALAGHGMGQVLDIVPNHMAIAGPQNVWWWDVLENGQASPFASFFDIDWDVPEARVENKLLLPILGDQYGRILDRGEIKLKREGEAFTVHYTDHTLPVAPRSLILLFDRANVQANSDYLSFISDTLANLPLSTVTDFEIKRKLHRDLRIVFSQLRHVLETEPETRAAVDVVVNEINASPDFLHELLERQNYRVAFWKSASQDLGYRRFFDINTLVGVRVEDERVLSSTHYLIFKWLGEGILDGIRVDHPDGLRDPEQYFRRLRVVGPNAWIVAEKILHPGERIPLTWPVAGTTGYDFLALLQGVFINQSGESAVTGFYQEFTGESTDWAHVAREKKHQVMHLLMGSDVNRLTELLLSVCEKHRRYRDYTRFELNEGLKELIACFPVYRTYVRVEDEAVRHEDRIVIAEAIETAIVNRPELDPEMFNFIRGLLLREYRGDLETEFVMRFQQLTGPVTAKGIEDTAFYCFNRFIALNEVGSDPSQFGISLGSFHQCMSERATQQPQSMLATSTHDTKRSEDVRARLAVLSEVPQAWIDAVRRWQAHNERYKTEGFPDRNAEYMLYQTLVGAWPIDKERLLTYMQKATRESKVHTSWTSPNALYESAVERFVTNILADKEFCADLSGFIDGIIPAGRTNSLTQTLIRLTGPGIPDTYQGTELWNLTLVDPDNRQPVDYETRHRLLAEVNTLPVEEIMRRMDEGLPKLLVLHRALQVRKEFPEALTASYRPIPGQGDKAPHVLAFSRQEQVIAVAPIMTVSLQGAWGNTTVDLPPGTWRNRLTGDTCQGTVQVQSLLQRFPVALLVKE